MTNRLSPLGLCADVAGLAAREMIVGVSPCEKHERVLARYARGRSRALARRLIVADLRAALAETATMRAADLLIVLRHLMAPESTPLRVSQERPAASFRCGRARRSSR